LIGATDIDKVAANRKGCFGKAGMPNGILPPPDAGKAQLQLTSGNFWREFATEGSEVRVR
jgi:hypothetical protein